MASDQPPADADLDALVAAAAIVRRSVESHIVHTPECPVDEDTACACPSLNPREVFDSLVDALRAARTAQAQAEQSDAESLAMYRSARDRAEALAAKLAAAERRVEEAFRAGFHARPTPTQTGWDFSEQGINMRSNGHHAWNAYAALRATEDR